MHKLQNGINLEQCIKLDWCINVNIAIIITYF